jgi:hypothetical protein
MFASQKPKKIATGARPPPARHDQSRYDNR